MENQTNSFAVKGMSTYYDQEKDRDRWRRAMNKREELIEKCAKNGLFLSDKKLKKMKTEDIEKKLEEHLEHYKSHLAARKGGR